MSRSPRINPALDAEPYAPYRFPKDVTMRLDGNEGGPVSPSVLSCLSELSPEALSRYPDPKPLEAQLAARAGLTPEQVVLTAGADEGLMRACRAFLFPGRELILPEPTFEMIPRFAAASGGTVVSVPYGRAGYPLDAVLDAISPDTGVIAVVSPNNPCGQVITGSQLRSLSGAAPGAMILVDLAYTEFADEDLTQLALTLPNVLVFRTFSKAAGLAGLRLGYAMGASCWVGALRAAGLPYPVSLPALLIATESLVVDEAQAQRAAQTVVHRERLRAHLTSLGVDTPPSQGNFILVRGVNPRWWRDGLAAQGIAIRAWPSREGLEDAVRISVPSDPAELSRLEDALAVIARPQALLFDLDGVLADVSRSYRQAIVQTADHFGVSLSTEQVEAAKAAGNANNDWILTQTLIEQAGKSVSLERVTQVFEGLYQGEDGTPGLCLTESMIGQREPLARLSAATKLAIVTGRPRRDAETFLKRFGLQEYFDAIVTMEDAPAKPDPEPVSLALRRLGVTRAWMLGDTPDDVIAARGAGVLPIGVRLPNPVSRAQGDVLRRAGAAAVFDDWERIQEVWR